MTIEFEFLGLVRRRTGIERWQVDASHTPGEQLQAVRTLGDALAALGRRFPVLVDEGWVECDAAGGSLDKHLIVNLDGRRFIRESSTPIPANCQLIVMSADVGG